MRPYAAGLLEAVAADVLVLQSGWHNGFCLCERRIALHGDVPVLPAEKVIRVVECSNTEVLLTTWVEYESEVPKRRMVFT